MLVGKTPCAQVGQTCNVRKFPIVYLVGRVGRAVIVGMPFSMIPNYRNSSPSERYIVTAAKKILRCLAERFKGKTVILHVGMQPLAEKRIPGCI